MRLIVGLGNPGARYGDTPHNAGSLACERFASRHHLGPESRRFLGRFARGRVGDEDVGVLRPQTYMNLSGDAVAEALRYLPVEPSDLIVVLDDLDIPAGRLRLRKKGGHGGHNGLRSVLEQIGSDEFPRIRVGIGRPPGGREPTGFLLGRVRPEERERFSKTVDRAVEALDCILERGIDAAMNRFNAMPAAGEESDDGAGGGRLDG